MPPLTHILFMGNTGHIVWMDCLKGVQSYAVSKGTWQVQLTSRLDPRHLQSVVRRADGVVGALQNVALTRTLVKWGIPYVTIGASIHYDPRLPTILFDDQAIGQMGAEHLLTLGFTHFAFAASHWIRSMARQEAFQNAIRQAGFDCLTHQPPKGRAGSWESIRRSMLKWVRSLPRPIAVMGGNDSQALQVIQACQDLGLRVPQEVAVLGVGNNELSWPAPVPLSSIAFDGETMGFKAATVLDGMMNGQSPPDPPIVVPPLGVVIRQSTDVLISTDPLVTKALDYIDEHACHGLDVAEICRHLCVSRRSLEQHFGSALNRTIHDAIRLRQVTRAKQLLIHTKLGLEEIAQGSGLRDSKALSRVFRQELGVPPARYRAKLKGQLPDS